MRYAVEVKLVERPDEWKRMRHTFDDAEAAERIRRAARVRRGSSASRHDRLNYPGLGRAGGQMNKQRIQDAHDAAVAQMDGKSFERHQTDCAVCQDFGRPTDLNISEREGE